jgi:hypothetical protein
MGVSDDRLAKSGPTADGLQTLRFKPSQVTPAAYHTSETALARRFTEMPRRVLVASLTASVELNHAFRGFGLPILAVVTICIAWTTFLILLTLKPNETANYLMDTSSLDDGQFWLIVETDLGLRVVSTAALVVVNLCFIQVLAKMIFGRRPDSSWRLTTLGTQMMNRIVTMGQNLLPETQRHLVAAWYDQVPMFWHELISISGRNRKYWVGFEPPTALVR